MKLTLAIFSPNKDAYSETFIRAHKKLPFSIKYYYDGSLPEKLENAGCLAYTFGQKIKRKLLNNFSLKEYALINSLKREKVDCVLAEYGPTAVASLKVLQYLKIPLVVHFHGFDASMKEVLSNFGAQYKQVFEYANRVIAVSKKMAATLLEMGCSKDKLIVSPCGPHPDFFKIEPAYISNQLIAIGRFVEKKAPHLTIRAFKKAISVFPEATLIMAGDGPLLAHSKNLVNELGITSNVVFKEVQSKENIIELFASSIAFVQHSVVAINGDSEGTPVVVLEAQAAALPVIATRHAGIPDVVIDNATGLLVNEHDIDAMSEAMIKILQNKSFAKQMGQAGRKRIKENFTMEKHLTEVGNAIKEAFDLSKSS